MTDGEREKIKAWVDNWKVAGEELDRLKWEEFRAMDQETAVVQAARAFAAAEGWRATHPGLIDRPCGMIAQQSYFSKWQKNPI